MTKTPDVQQFSGSLIGQCLGDALGFVVEGESPSVCAEYVENVLKPGKVENFGRRHHVFGQYSDDSQLARDLMVSFLHCREFNPADYAARIAAIFAEGRIVGRGLATDRAAKRLARGVSWEESGEAESHAGNGTAMRAGPVGLFYSGDPQKMTEVAHLQGLITHKDKRCSAGSVAIAGAVAAALRGGAIEPKEFAGELAGLIQQYDPILAEALHKLPGWLNDRPEDVAPRVSTIGVEEEFHYGWKWISPFVTSSVLWSIYSFLRTPDNYFESVCTAIACGGDVDTTAAMTGAISGARLGLQGIPSDLAEQVNDNGTWKYVELVKLAQDYHSLAMREGNE